MKQTVEFEMVVGLEVHVQLKTLTKAFCSCSTAYGALPNANTCPFCLGLPGTLPALNAEAVRLAVRTALALKCEVRSRSVFSRKNYFYPDLPKGYQITQYDLPLAEDGVLVIPGDNGKPMNVFIARVHMEEDAGKSIHDRFPGVTAIDLNRAGVPLIEIVSQPDMRSSRQAGAYIRTLKQLLEFIGASDGSMEEGSLRVDANVSALPFGRVVFGTRTEIKNMNSISGVERALEIEFARQCDVLRRGGAVEQQTMLWDAARGEVRPSRSKEASHDYRYFPEPDLPALVLSKEFIQEMRAKMPELPEAKRRRFEDQYFPMLRPGMDGIVTPSPQAITIEELISRRELADYFEAVVRLYPDPVGAANWVRGEIRGWLNAHDVALDQLKISPPSLAELLKMIDDGNLSHTAARQVFELMASTGGQPRAIAEKEGLLQERDSGALAQWVDEVLAENAPEAGRFLGGEKKLQGVLVGLVMKKSKGRADPKQVNQLLAERASRTGA